MKKISTLFPLQTVKDQAIGNSMKKSKEKKKKKKKEKKANKTTIKLHCSRFTQELISRGVPFVCYTGQG